jgi:hypothetical protein
MGVNLCARGLIVSPSILVLSKKNSTLQHYDAIEIIARTAENCVCMFVIVNDRRNARGVRHEFLYVQILSSADRVTAQRTG